MFMVRVQRFASAALVLTPLLERVLRQRQPPRCTRRRLDQLRRVRALHYE